MSSNSWHQALVLQYVVLNESTFCFHRILSGSVSVSKSIPHSKVEQDLGGERAAFTRLSGRHSFVNLCFVECCVKHWRTLLLMTIPGFMYDTGSQYTCTHALDFVLFFLPARSCFLLQPHFQRPFRVLSVILTSCFFRVLICAILTGQIVFPSLAPFQRPMRLFSSGSHYIYMYTHVLDFASCSLLRSCFLVQPSVYRPFRV